MLTGEVKKVLIDILVTMVERHRRARAAVSEEVCCINLIFLLSLRRLNRGGHFDAVFDLELLITLSSILMNFRVLNSSISD